MSELAVGGALRALRLRFNRRQLDVAASAAVPRSVVSLIERGDLDRVSIGQLRRVAAALDARIRVAARWRGGDLDRLVNGRHAAMHETMARFLAEDPSWQAEPEVSFAYFGERGVIDWLVWHSPSRSLLIIELKTEFVDVQATLGQLDRYRRLAEVAAERFGWRPASVSTWLVLAARRTNARHAARHRTLLRTALPADGHAVRSWMRKPAGAIRAFSLMPYAADTSLDGRAGAPTRVLRARPATATDVNGRRSGPSGTRRPGS